MGGLSDKEEIEKVKQELREHYDVKTMKEVDYILEIKMEKVEKGIWISQRAYIIQKLEKFGTNQNWYYYLLKYYYPQMIDQK